MISLRGPELEDRSTISSRSQVLPPIKQENGYVDLFWITHPTSYMGALYKRDSTKPLRNFLKMYLYT